jgi:hypothetical protein
LRRSKEKHDLGEQRSHLVVTSATNSRKLKEIEDEILRVLDDENSNEVLSTSVALSNEISKKQKITQETEWEIDVTRQGYMPVAKHTSVLFFCTMDLGHLDPAYQYSLNWSILLWRGSGNSCALWRATCLPRHGLVLRHVPPSSQCESRWIYPTTMRRYKRVYRLV